MFKQYSIAAARNSLPALVHAVESGAPVELTRRGKPVAMLISIADYRNLDLGKPDLWEAIQRFRQETDLSDLDVDEIALQGPTRTLAEDVQALPRRWRTTRREFAQELLRKAKVHIDTNEQVRKKAKEFTESGIKPLDALHLASSIEAESDFFCTCDDKFLKKARAVDSSTTKVVSPLELVAEMDE